MVTVILAEKPTQAQAYVDAFKSATAKKGYYVVNDDRYFSGEAIVTWAIGHLVQPVMPGYYKKEWERWNLQHLPIFPDVFEYEVVNKKGAQFTIVKGLLKKASEIIIATDSGREGENIARSIINKVGVSKTPTKRLWIKSLEVSDVQEGFSSLEDGKKYLPLYKAAQARQIGDWLVGMNASPLYSLLLQKKGISESFSIGRVQTPTLYMINKRQQEILNFKPQPFFELYSDVEVAAGKFRAKYSGRFEQKADVQMLMEKHNINENEMVEISKVTKGLKEITSPQLHSLSSLQTKANKVWKYSPSEVLDIMQSLYDKKLLTYPRTDSNFITESEFQYLKANIRGYQNIAGVNLDIAFPEARKRYVDGTKVKDHYAIIPTKAVPAASELAELNDKEKNIYFEVVLTTLAIFAPSYQYEETTVEIDIKGLIFQAKGKIEVNKGWKSLFQSIPKKDEEMDQDENETKLPAIREGESASTALITKEGITKPPKPYTQGQLINLMKTAGKSVEDEESKNILNKTEGLGTEATRANIIESLEEKNYIQVKKNKVEVTKKGEILCEAVEGHLLSKPELTAKWEVYLEKIAENSGDQAKFLQGIKNFITHLIEQAPETLDSANIEARIKNAVEESYIASCPACKKGHLKFNRNFYSCTEYSSGCKYTLPGKILNKTLTENHIKQLISKGKTTLIKGFMGKSKKKFDAYLVIKDGKVEFDFPSGNVKPVKKKRKVK
ncbi:DNA topoisomerase 3 [Bacillus subtilis]